MNLYNSFLARHQGFIIKNFYKTRYGKSLRELKDIHKNKRCFIVDDYESTRFTATDSHTAVITSEYNMECVKEWLQRQTPIAEMREF